MNVSDSSHHALLGARCRAAVAVSLFAALLVFPPLGHRVIATGGYNGDDEARYPLLARDVLERGAWFAARYRWATGGVFRDKPPLYHWVIAIASLPSRAVTPLTARLPVATATLIVVLFTFFLGADLFTRRAGVWAALIVATSYDVFANSQLVLPDMLVLAFATVAGWAFWRAVTTGSRGWLAGFYAAVALSVYAKGPLGLLPLLSAGIWSWTGGCVRAVTQRLWSPLGIGLFVVITLTWLGPFLMLGADSWVRDSVWSDWLLWYFGSARSVSELLYAVLVGFLPWTVLLPVVMPSLIRAWGDASVRFAILWCLVPLVVLMMSHNFKQRYALPVYPGAALLVGWWADVHGRTSTYLGRVSGMLAAALFAALGMALYVPMWWHWSIRPYFTGGAWELLPATLGFASIGAAMCWGLYRGRPTVFMYVTVLATAATLAYGIWPYNRRYNKRWDFPRLAATAEQYAAGRDVAVFRYSSDEWAALDFYLGRAARSLESPTELTEYLTRTDHPVLVIEAGDLRSVHGPTFPALDVLSQVQIGRKTLLIVRAATANDPERLSSLMAPAGWGRQHQRMTSARSAPRPPRTDLDLT